MALHFPAPAPTARCARLLEHLPLPIAARARRLRNELTQRCLADHPLYAAAAAAIACDDERSRRRSASAARFALGQMIELNLFRGAAEGLFERDFEIVAQVGTTRRSAAPRLRLLPAHAIAEENIEDVSETAAEPLTETEIAEAAGSPIAHGSVPIVLRALLRIGKDFVSFVDLFEAMLRFRLVVRDVGMMLAGERAIGAFYFVGARGMADPEHFVEIFGRHAGALFDFDVRQSFRKGFRRTGSQRHQTP